MLTILFICISAMMKIILLFVSTSTVIHVFVASNTVVHLFIAVKDCRCWAHTGSCSAYVDLQLLRPLARSLSTVHRLNAAD